MITMKIMMMELFLTGQWLPQYLKNSEGNDISDAVFDNDSLIDLESVSSGDELIEHDYGVEWSYSNQHLIIPKMPIRPQSKI